MKIWILFIWMSGATPHPSGFSYTNKDDCEKDGAVYKRYACVQVEVPKK